MTAPLLMLGPGGDYQSRYVGRGTGLIRDPRPAASASTGGETDSNGGHAGYHEGFAPKSLDTVQHSASPLRRAADRFTPSPLVAGPGIYDAAGNRTGQATRPELLLAAAAWLDAQSLAISDLAHDHAAHRRLVASAPTSDDLQKLVVAIIPPAAPTAHLTLRSPQYGPQPHAQAAQNPQPHPRNPAHAGLFTDDAGTRRRTRRLQGHRLRARRSAHQEGGLGPAKKQSALFGSLA